jgi:hypothetical protein
MGVLELDEIGNIVERLRDLRIMRARLSFDRLQSAEAI